MYVNYIQLSIFCGRIESTKNARRDTITPISYDLNYVIFLHMVQLICFLPFAGEESSL